MNFVNITFQELEICSSIHFAVYLLLLYWLWYEVIYWNLSCLFWLFFFQACQHWAQSLYVNQAWKESWVCIVAVQLWIVVLEAHDLIVLVLQTLCHILSSVGSTPQAVLQNLPLHPLPVVALHPLLLLHLTLPIRQSPPTCSSCWSVCLLHL